MARITCHVAFVRDGLAAKAPPFDALKTWIEASFRRAASAGSANSGFELRLEQSAAEARIPSSWTTNAVGLQDSLREVLGPATKHGLGVDEICLLFADRLAGHPGVFGMMFDSGFSGRTSADHTPREGCAVFLDAIADHRPSEDEREKEIFFTCAHELGHVFNLWHLEEPVSLMSSSPSGDEAYPVYEHRFHDDHAEFLRQVGSSKYVHPGGSSFGVRGSLGPAGGVSTNVVGGDGAFESLELQTEVYGGELYGFEPIELDVTLSTRGAAPVQIPDRMDPGYEDFTVWIERPDGERYRYRSPRRYCRNDHRVRVTQDRPLRRDVSIFAQAGGYTFSAPGEHRVWVEWRMGSRVLRSEPTTVSILQARPGRRRFDSLVRILTRPNIARLLYHRRGSMRGVGKQLEKLRAFGSSVGLEYAVGCALLRRTSRRRNRPQRERGKKCLEQALQGLDPKSNRYRRAEALLDDHARRTRSGESEAEAGD